jgi:hypothetical protein
MASEVGHPLAADITHLLYLGPMQRHAPALKPSRP